LIDSKDGASSLSCGLEDVDSNLFWLPDELLIEVINVSLKNVDTKPQAFLSSLGMLLS